jgi:hypothetical protein
MGRRKCRVILTLIVAGSIALTGCKKEADQIVSKPLDTVKGATVAASASPTPKPSPTVRRTATPRPSASPSASASPILTDKETLKGAVEEEIYNPLWLKVLTGFLALAMVALLGFAIYGVGMGGDVVEDETSSDLGSSDGGEGLGISLKEPVAAG